MLFWMAGLWGGRAPTSLGVIDTWEGIVRTVTVQIIETKTSRLVATHPVTIGFIGRDPSEQDYSDEAWKCSVEDKTVDATRREAYTFRFLEG